MFNSAYKNFPLDLKIACKGVDEQYMSVLNGTEKRVSKVTKGNAKTRNRQRAAESQSNFLTQIPIV